MKKITCYTLCYLFGAIAFFICFSAVNVMADNASETAIVEIIDENDNLDNQDLGLDLIKNQFNIPSHYSTMTINELTKRADKSILAKKPGEAMGYLFEAVSRSSLGLSEKETECLAMAYSNMGYLLLSEYQNLMWAYPFLEKSLELLINMPSSHISAPLASAVYNNMGQLFMMFGDMERALQYLRKAFQLSLKADSDDTLMFSFIDMLHCAWLSGSLSSIEEEYRAFMDAEVKCRFEWLNIYAGHIEEAARCYRTGCYNTSLSELDKAQQSLTGRNFIFRYPAITYILSASTAIKMGNLELSHRYLSQAEAEIASHNLQDLRDDLYRLESVVARLQGNDSIANVMNLRALALQDSLFGIQTYGKILDRHLAWNLAHRNNIAEEKGESGVSWWVYALTVIVVLGALYFIAKVRVQRKPKQGNFARKGEKKNQGGADAVLREQENMRATFEKVLNFIENDSGVFALDFSIETLASATGLKVKDISQSIKSERGCNFSTLLAERRVREACRILLDRTVTVRPTMEEVAERVGYHSRSHFSRVFKSVTGKTTTEFLRNEGQPS